MKTVAGETGSPESLLRVGKTDSTWPPGLGSQQMSRGAPCYQIGKCQIGTVRFLTSHTVTLLEYIF